MSWSTPENSGSGRRCARRRPRRLGLEHLHRQAGSCADDGGGQAVGSTADDGHVHPAIPAHRPHSALGWPGESSRRTNCRQTGRIHCGSARRPGRGPLGGRPRSRKAAGRRARGRRAAGPLRDHRRCRGAGRRAQTQDRRAGRCRPGQRRRRRRHRPRRAGGQRADVEHPQRRRARARADAGRGAPDRARRRVAARTHLEAVVVLGHRDLRQDRRRGGARPDRAARRPAPRRVRHAHPGLRPVCVVRPRRAARHRTR